MTHSGIILLKYWLEVDADEQTRRLEARIDDARKTWKLSPMDLKSYRRWRDYTRARDDMFAATDTEMRAVVRRRLERQEASPAQHHPAHPRPRAVRTDPAGPRHVCPSARAPTEEPTEHPWRRVPDRY